MNPLKIKTSGLVTNFIDRYSIWKDYCKFYKGSGAPFIVHAEDGIPCFHYTDVKKINNSTADLIAIDCMTEGLHSMSHFKKYNTNKKYIIFSNGDWKKEYHVLPFEYDLIHTLFFLFEMADTYNSPNRFCYHTDKNYNFDSAKPYSFVSTIGNVRKERNLAVQKLIQLHPKRKFILRYSGQDLAQASDHLDEITFSPGKFDPYIFILEKYYHNVSQSLPMSMYNSARFNLVVETDLDYQQCFFLTEKTVKVLLSGMPFVSLSHPGFLTRLHQLGFYTYNSLWDENYDQEINYNTRVTKIVDLCDKLCDFDWDANREQLELIKLKNQSNFLSLHKVAEQEFYQLESNILKYIT